MLNLNLINKQQAFEEALWFVDIAVVHLKEGNKAYCLRALGKAAYYLNKR